MSLVVLCCIRSALVIGRRSETSGLGDPALSHWYRDFSVLSPATVGAEGLLCFPQCLWPFFPVLPLLGLRPQVGFLCHPQSSSQHPVQSAEKTCEGVCVQTSC